MAQALLPDYTRSVAAHQHHHEISEDRPIYRKQVHPNQHQRRLRLTIHRRSRESDCNQQLE